MKSDRLVAILLMLQRREQVTAAEVAKELEVSERTARRDLDALGMAGSPSIRSRVVPVGGVFLVADAQTYQASPRAKLAPCSLSPGLRRPRQLLSLS